MSIETNKHVDQYTGALAINVTMGPGMLESVRLHLSAVGGAVENFVVQTNIAAGAVYDTVLSTTNMNAVADVHYLPARPIALELGDVIDITYNNANGRTWGLEIIYRTAGEP